MRLMALVIAAAAPALASCAVNPPAATAQLQDPQSVVDQLLAQDRAFAAAAAGQPAIESLSGMIDDDVAMFIVPVPGLARNRAQATELMQKAFGSDPTTLRWTTVRVGVSADASQGFTYGFMDRLVDGKPAQLGKYVAYWIKRAAGWRVAAFKMVPRPEGPVSTELRAPSLPNAIVPTATDAATVEAYRASLDQTERQFSADSQVTSIGTAFRKYGSADAMNVGGNADFTYSNDAIADGQGGDSDDGSPVRWAPDGVLVASSGDLGVTFGYLLRNAPTPPGKLPRIPFFTIWRRATPQAPWRYIAE